jgi:hypothetical protein
MPKSPKKPEPITASTIAQDKALMKAKARGNFSAVVREAYKPENLLPIGVPNEEGMRNIARAEARFENIDIAVAEFGRWAGMARTDIKGYNPKKK